MAFIRRMVRFTAVGLRYPSPDGREGPEALADLTFTLPEGSFTWLLGASGAGKSSLLRLMHLALLPTRGELEVLGVRVNAARRAALPALRRRIGVVFQDFRLLPYLSAFDNVALPLRLAGRSESSLRPDVTEMLRWVGLPPVALVAAFVSYRHLSGLLDHYNEETLVVWFGPLAVDGLMLMATSALLATGNRTSRPTGTGAGKRTFSVP